MNGLQFWLLVFLFSAIIYGWYLHEESKGIPLHVKKMRRFNKRVGRSIDHLSPIHRACMFVRDEYGIGIVNAVTSRREHYECYLPREWALNARICYSDIMQEFYVESIKPREYNQYHVQEIQAVADLLNKALAEEKIFIKRKNAISGFSPIIVLFITMWFGTTPNI